MEQRQWPILALFCLLHVLVFTLVFTSGAPDVEGYYRYATRITEGQIPYRDFSVEYPPGSLLVFLLPRLFTSSLEAYGQAFAVEMLVFDLISLLGAVRLGQRLGQSQWKTALVYTLAMLSIGPTMVQRYDLAPAALTLLAILFFCQKHYNIAWAFLAIGTMTKLYPAALAPVFLIYQLKHHGNRHIIAQLAVFASVILIMAVPFLAIGGDGFIEAFSVQGGRLLQVESTYASVLLLGQMMGLGTAHVYLGRFSFDVASPLSESLADYSFIVTAVSLLTVYILFWHREGKPKGSGDSDTAYLVNFSILVICVLLITLKVFSPQFIIWLLPLVAIINGRRRQTLWIVFIAVGLLTYCIYPMHYSELVNMQPAAIIALFVRNLLVIVMAILLALEGQGKTNPPKTPPEIRQMPSTY